MTILIILYPVLFCLYLGSLILHRGLFVLKTYPRMSHFIWVQTILCALLGAEIQAKQYRVSDFKNRVLILIWLSWSLGTLFCFAYISDLRYPTENCLYQKCTSGCHLSFEICPSFLPCFVPGEIKPKPKRNFFLGHPVVHEFITWR